MQASSPPGAILVIGASLEAERVVDLVRQLPDPPTILGLIAVDPTTEKVGVPVCRLPVLDTLENVAHFADRIVGAVPAAENVDDREMICATLARCSIPALSLIHPKACIGPDVEIGPGAVIHANATLDARVRIGRGAVVGLAATLGARTRVGDYAEIAQGCVVGPEVRIGERTRLDLGCRITAKVLVGPNAAVGPGSLVTTDVPGNAQVIGNPAKPVERVRHPEMDGA